MIKGHSHDPFGGLIVTTDVLTGSRLEELLGDEAESLLQHRSTTIDASLLHLPGPDFVDRIFTDTDRSSTVLRNLQWMFDHGRLGGTGYVSILPVDQGIEHSGGASFAPNPKYFDPENLVELAVEGGCNAFASTLGVLGAVSRRWAHKLPFIVKLNHNELLTYPNGADQIMFASAQRAADMGAVGVGATIYFGSPESDRQIVEVSRAFEEAHRLGMFTVLWCYLRNSAFKQDGVDYSLSADLTGQANHLGVTIEADIIKQKLPEVAAPGFTDLNFGKTDKRVYSDLMTPHPIDMTRYQLANCYMGRAGLINSGGASGANDLQDAVKTAVINKRAGGTGLISGRKAFQKPVADGIELLNAIQDVYLSPEVTIA
jgi:class I fructose-bisphosphate aldolase